MTHSIVLVKQQNNPSQHQNTMNLSPVLLKKLAHILDMLNSSNYFIEVNEIERAGLKATTF